MPQPMSYRAIGELLGVPSSTVSDIFHHAVNNATAKRVLREKEEATQQAGYEADQYLAGIDSALAAFGLGGDQDSGADIGGGSKPTLRAAELIPEASAELVPEASELVLEGPLQCALEEASGKMLPVGVRALKGASEKTLPVGGHELSVVELIASDVLDVTKRPGRPSILSAEDKDRLVAFVKRDFHTRRMKLVDIRREVGFGHVSDSTVYRALLERGMKAYREDFKFILTAENKLVRLVCSLFAS